MPPLREQRMEARTKPESDCAEANGLNGARPPVIRSDVTASYGAGLRAVTEWAQISHLTSRVNYAACLATCHCSVTEPPP